MSNIGGNEEKKRIARQLLASYASKFDINVISTTEIMNLRRRNEEIILVDVRDKDEMDVSVIPGSISKEKFLQDYELSLSKSHLIVPYCTIGYRSGVFATELRARGFTNVSNGEGVLLWTFDQENLVTTDLEGNQVITQNVHTYHDSFNYIADNYNAVYYPTLRVINDNTCNAL